MDGAPTTLTVGHATTVPDDWEVILALAKTHRGTLGFLTDTAFLERLQKGTLVVARIGGELAGYCLYDVPRSGYIKLVHVCVAQRGRGIGKALIDEAVRAHPTAIGVIAYCRRDYHLERFWTAAGLSPRGEKPGRAIDGSTLTRWWKALGELDLLEDAALGTGLPLVAYDTNVITDLFGSAALDRADREASLGLTADWLSAEITPVISRQVDIEIDRIEDRVERNRQRDGFDHLVRLRDSASTSPGIKGELLRRVGARELASDESLTDDLQHVADAIAAGVSYLVSNDGNLLKLAPTYLPADSGLKIVRPHELIGEIDEKLGQPVFQSRLIENVQLTWEPAGEHDINTLVTAFVGHERQEKGGDLRRAIQTALAQHPRSTRVLRGPDGALWALLAEKKNDATLEVPLVRVARRKETATVALQLARYTRHIARDNQLDRVRITDDTLTDTMAEALTIEGFEHSRVATVIDKAQEVSEFLVSYPEVNLVTTGQVRDQERRFWPLILLGAKLPTFIAPIQPRFMYPLFGADRAALLEDERPLALGLSREHVYYSGSAKGLPTPGARIIWYATKDDTETVRRLVATSRCLGTERATVKDAFKRYEQFGVLTYDHVKAAQNTAGLVTVVRFEDTELLGHQPGGSNLRVFLAEHDVKQPIQSFRQVPPSVFDDLIRRQQKESL